MFEEVWTWASKITVGGVGAWGALAGIVTLLIRQRPINQKIANEREGNLLRERTLDMRGMRRRITELEAEQRVDRHTIGNLEACFDALLMMLELNPERAQEAASKARQMRKEMKKGEVAEKAAIIAAAITGDDKGRDTA
jgi:hypothetical protein